MFSEKKIFRKFLTSCQELHSYFLPFFCIGFCKFCIDICFKHSSYTNFIQSILAARPVSVRLNVAVPSLSFHKNLFKSLCLPLSFTRVQFYQPPLSYTLKYSAIIYCYSGFLHFPGIFFTKILHHISLHCLGLSYFGGCHWLY